MTTITAFIVFTTLIYIVLLLFVLSKPRPSKAYYRYVGFLIFGTLWVGVGALEVSNLRFDQDLYLLFSKLDFVFAAGLSYFVSLFALHFPKDNKKVKPFFELLLALPIVFVMILSILGNVFNYNSSGEIEYNLVKYYAYYGIVVIYLLGVTLTTFIFKIRKATGLEKSQLLYITLGYSITVIVGLFFSVYFAYNTRIVDYIGIANITTLLFAFSTFYAFYRYRLFDIRLAIKRGAVRATSFIVIFGVYLFAVLSLKDSINISSESGQTTFLVVATLIVVATIEPIRKLVNSIVDKTFESRDKKQQEAQAKIRLTLKSQQNVENLTESICNYLKATFNLEDVHFIEKGDLFFDKHRETKTFLQSMGRILIPEELPYRVEESEKYFFINKELQGVRESAFLTIGQDDLFMGCFALGKRKGGTAYTVEEVRELKRLQDDFTEALLNARLYQQAIARIKI